MDSQRPHLPLLLLGDARALAPELEPESVDCIVTSPPYFRQRSYAAEGEIGWEESPDEYVEELSDVFDALRHALRPSATIFVNLGDSYMEGGVPGYIRREIAGIPWLFGFAMRRRGWRVRSEIIWDKPNAMPESVTDRPTRSHEHILLLTLTDSYYWNYEAGLEPIAPSSVERYRYPRRVTKSAEVRMQSDFTQAERERGMRNVRSVWRISTEKVPYEHTATMPEAIVERCLALGCPEAGTVLDPFCGTGTTVAVAMDMGLESIGFDISEVSLAEARHRLGRWTPRRLRRTQLALELPT